MEEVAITHHKKQRPSRHEEDVAEISSGERIALEGLRETKTTREVPLFEKYAQESRREEKRFHDSPSSNRPEMSRHRADREEVLDDEPVEEVETLEERHFHRSHEHITAGHIKRKLDRELDGYAIVDDVSDRCGSKFKALVISPMFEECSLLDRQRLVNRVLSEEMKSIHAFSQRTLAPSELGSFLHQQDHHHHSHHHHL
ncbi:BOLA2B [Cordylochernes scorpioides]|uniref:BOLA2B n=1 Tax=Cordylochernes scorpioides TaxID=51811 RepID=A0ABY6KFU2_9ARAC|nr:BOLA2B [Cordylochernes scorpioides]